jgi:signal transduction histidine kinase
MVFQVAREAMRNAVQHSRSPAVTVNLWQEDGCIRVSVRDEGVGFHTEEARESSHFGLKLMAERAEAVGGRLVVDSVLGQGTSISLTMPPDA